MLVALDVPVRAARGRGYVKLKFGGSSWPIATAACVLRVADGADCRRRWRSAGRRAGRWRSISAASPAVAAEVSPDVGAWPTRP